MEPFSEEQREFIRDLVEEKISDYDFLHNFLKRIQSKDSWKDYKIEPSIMNINGEKFYNEMFEKLPPTISKAVFHNNSFNVYFYDEIYDRWFGIISYEKPTAFAMGRPEPIHNEQFTLLEFS